DLAARDLEIDVDQGLEASEPAADPADLDARSGVALDRGAHERCPFTASRVSVTIAAIPGLSSGAGSSTTLTANTWSVRWASVWMFRGVYSARVRISVIRPPNARFGHVSTVIVAGWPTCTKPSSVSDT